MGHFNLEILFIIIFSPLVVVVVISTHVELQYLHLLAIGTITSEKLSFFYLLCRLSRAICCLVTVHKVNFKNQPKIIQHCFNFLAISPNAAHFMLYISIQYYILEETYTHTTKRKNETVARVCLLL